MINIFEIIADEIEEKIEQAFAGKIIRQTFLYYSYNRPVNNIQKKEAGGIKVRLINQESKYQSWIKEQ